MLPYMVGYKALALQQGISLSSRISPSRKAVEEKENTPGPLTYRVKSPSFSPKRMTIGPRIEYRGVIVSDDF